MLDGGSGALEGGAECFMKGGARFAHHAGYAGVRGDFGLVSFVVFEVIFVHVEDLGVEVLVGVDLVVDLLFEAFPLDCAGGLHQPVHKSGLAFGPSRVELRWFRLDVLLEPGLDAGREVADLFVVNVVE